MDSAANPKKKTTKGEGVGVRSLTHSTLGVEGCVGIRDGTRKIDKQVTYSHKLAQTKQ